MRVMVQCRNAAHQELRARWLQQSKINPQEAQQYGLMPGLGPIVNQSRGVSCMCQDNGSKNVLKTCTVQDIVTDPGGKQIGDACSVISVCDGR